jgi:hypothetical protein
VVVTCGQVPIPKEAKDELFTPRSNSITGFNTTGDADSTLRSPGDMVNGFIIRINPADGYEGPAEQQTVPFDPWLTLRQETKVHSVESLCREVIGRRPCYSRSVPLESATYIIHSAFCKALDDKLLASIEKRIDAQGLSNVDAGKLRRSLYPDMSRTSAIGSRWRDL